MKSILVQNIREFEIIIINDGSTDQSLSIVEKYEKKYDNIVVIDKANEGQGIARNIGLKYAKGKYIGFVDADDYIDMSMFERMLFAAIEYDMNIVTCGYYNVDERYNIINKNYSVTKSISSEEAIINAIYGNSNFGACNKLFKKSFLEHNNIHFLEGIYYEDIYMVIEALSNTNKIYNIEECLYYYVKHSGSTTSYKTLKHAKDFIYQFEISLKYIKEKYQDTNKYLIKLYEHINCMIILRFFYNENTIFEIWIKKIEMAFKERNIFLFGASNLGIELYEKINAGKIKQNIVAFCDNDINKHGKYIKDVPIINPLNIKNYDLREPIIVISSVYFSQICEQLHQLGLAENIFTLSYSDIKPYIKDEVK